MYENSRIMQQWSPNGFWGMANAVKLLPKEARHSLDRPLKYFLNNSESDYLLLKVNNEYVSDATRRFAKEITPELKKEHPYLEAFMPAISRVEKLRIDLHNGFSQLASLINPELRKKARVLQDAEFTIGYVRDAQITGASLPDKVRKLYAEAIAGVKKNRFSEGELNEGFRPMETARDRAISRNVNRFNVAIMKVFPWQDAKTAECDAFLNVQHRKNGELWRKIEQDKKLYFSKESVAAREKAWREPIEIDDFDFDNLPF